MAPGQQLGSARAAAAHFCHSDASAWLASLGQRLAAADAEAARAAAAAATPEGRDECAAPGVGTTTAGASGVGFGVGTTAGGSGSGTTAAGSAAGSAPAPDSAAPAPDAAALLMAFAGRPSAAGGGAPEQGGDPRAPAGRAGKRSWSAAAMSDSEGSDWGPAARRGARGAGGARAPRAHAHARPGLEGPCASCGSETTSSDCWRAGPGGACALCTACYARWRNAGKGAAVPPRERRRRPGPKLAGPCSACAAPGTSNGWRTGPGDADVLCGACHARWWRGGKGPVVPPPKRARAGAGDD